MNSLDDSGASPTTLSFRSKGGTCFAAGETRIPRLSFHGALSPSIPRSHPGFLDRDRRIQPGSDVGEGWSLSPPSQLIHVVKERDVGSQRGQIAEEQSVFHLSHERTGQRSRVRHIHVPIFTVSRNVFEVQKFGQHRRG